MIVNSNLCTLLWKMQSGNKEKIANYGVKEYITDLDLIYKLL